METEIQKTFISVGWLVLRDVDSETYLALLSNRIFG